MKKLLKYGIITLLVVFLFLLLVPWLFRDEIFRKIKEEANKNLKGELEIRDLRLSLMRDFPNLTLSLYDVIYTGEEPFEGVELLNIELLRAELDLVSVIKGDKIDISEIYFRNPSFDVRVLEDGSTNYDVIKSEEETEEIETDEEASPFNIALKKLEIDNLNLVYDDREGQIFSEIKKGSLTLKGDFTQVVTDLYIEALTKELTVGYEEINYLNKVELNSKISANYNTIENKITLTDNEVFLNKLQLFFEGWLQMFDDKMSLDLRFNAPKADFKEFLSLIPAMFMQDFQGLKTSGKFALKGDVTGHYPYEGEELPAFNLFMLVENGIIQYPDLPTSITDINIDLAVTHPQGIDDLTVIDIKKGNFSVAGSRFQSTLKVRTPVSDPDLDFFVKTKLDLNKLMEAVPVEGTQMSGILHADARMKGKTSDFENEQYENVVAEGWMGAGKMKIDYEELTAPVEIDTFYMALSPQKFDLPVLNMKLGNSDFDGSGSLKNMFSYVFKDDTLFGLFNLQSKYIDANQLTNILATDSTATSSATSTAAKEKPLVAPEIPGNLDFKIAARVGELLYDDMKLTNLQGAMHIADAMVKLIGFDMDLLEGKILMNGSYTIIEGKPLVDMDLKLQNLSVKTAFTSFNTIQKFAPIASTTTGIFSINLKYGGKLNQNLEPDLSSINSEGSLVTLGLKLQPDIMQKVAQIMQDDKFKSLKFSDANLSFKITNGRVYVNPIKMKLGDFPATFSGSHGLDQSMNYSLKTNLPIDKVKLPKEAQAFGITVGNLPVEFVIGGTLTNPTVKPVFGKPDDIKDAIKTVVTESVTMVVDSAKKVVNRETEKILADAAARVERVINEAQKQADAIKAEGLRQGEMIRGEAKKQGEKLIAEAGNNPIKLTAARAAADKLNSQANKRAKDVENEANKRADQVMNTARAERDRIMKEAEEKVKIK